MILANLERTIHFCCDIQQDGLVHTHFGDQFVESGIFHRVVVFHSQT